MERLPPRFRPITAKCDDLAGPRRGTTGRPSFHQLAALLKQITAPIGSLGLILDDVRKCSLADLVGEVCAFTKRCSSNQLRTPRSPGLNLQARLLNRVHSVFR